jgi:hypothetical protein
MNEDCKSGLALTETGRGQIHGPCEAQHQPDALARTIGVGGEYDASWPESQFIESESDAAARETQSHLRCNSPR